MLLTPTVFVVDDDTPVLDSLTSLLGGHGFIAECFPSAEEYLSQVTPDRPGCLVLDLLMPGMTGVELLERMTALQCHRPVLAITGYSPMDAIVQIVKLGAVDVLQKPFSPSRLIESVRKALQIDAARREGRSECVQARLKINALSAEERMVLSGIVRGLTNQAIADELDVSLRTVQFRRTSLCKSLGLSRRSELLLLSQQANWFPDRPVHQTLPVSTPAGP